MYDILLIPVLHRFEDFAHKISAIARQESFVVFGLLASKAINVASYSIDRDMDWPFVTIPHFEERGTSKNRLSKALQLSLVPIVPKELKTKWEEFSYYNQSWVQEGVNASPHLHEEFLGPDLQVDAIPLQVFRFDKGTSGSTTPEDDDGVDFGPGEYGVVWQQAPAPHYPSIINFNLLSHPVFARVYNNVWESTQAVLSEVLDLSFLYIGAVKDEITHPHSFLMQPIYTSLKDKIEQNSLVGFIVGVLPWDSYFVNLLPRQIKGILVVLHNSCGEPHSYRLDGSEAIYLGKYDLHDSKYDHLMISSEFGPGYQNVSTTYCEYEIRIYPSSSFEDSYRTDGPWIYAIVVFALFLFTARKYMQNNQITILQRPAFSSQTLLLSCFCVVRLLGSAPK